MIDCVKSPESSQKQNFYFKSFLLFKDNVAWIWNFNCTLWQRSLLKPKWTSKNFYIYIHTQTPVDLQNGTKSS